MNIEHYRNYIAIVETGSLTGAANKMHIAQSALSSMLKNMERSFGTTLIIANRGIRKIEPLRKKLSEVDAWITGQRKDQSPTRAEIPVIQDDKLFARPNSTLTKFNPLANWTSQEVWGYIRMCEIPYNELHNKGFISIGCEPCTRPVGPNQHEREGRWWWEEATKKECGLHSGNTQS